MASPRDNPRAAGSEQLHICHLTVLNPARHSRIFYKEARSQVAMGYRVTIIGQDGAGAPYEEEGVQIIPTGVFSRLSLSRWTAARRLVRLAAAQQADLYQIHAPELLAPAQSLLKMVPGTRLLYDMHEDYFLNIREAGYYPRWIKGILAEWARKKELNFTRYGHGVIYAEDCFREILDFPIDRSAIVRNKYLPPKKVTPPAEFGKPTQPLLVFTGTIAENWGVTRAIELWQRLQATLPVRLAVVGHTHDRALLGKIQAMVRESGFPNRFKLVGGEKFVPYEDLAGWIAAADAGIALYKLLPNIRERIPTKFYEFMAAGKPILHTANPSWDSIFEPKELGISLNWPPTQEELRHLAQRIQGSRAGRHSLTSPRHAWSWDTEAAALSTLLQTVLATT